MMKRELALSLQINQDVSIYSTFGKEMKEDFNYYNYTSLKPLK